MRILLADDDVQVCSALRLLIDQEAGLEVVDEVMDGLHLLTQIERSQPDLVLIDWELCNFGLRDLAMLRDDFPAVKVVAMSCRPEARENAQVAAVDGFVSKGSPAEKLLTVIRSTAAGAGGQQN